jgi:hypothetical protein
MHHTFCMLGTAVLPHFAESIVLYTTGPIKGMPVTMDGALVGVFDSFGDDEFGHRFKVNVPTGAVSVTAGSTEIEFRSAATPSE